MHESAKDWFIIGFIATVLFTAASWALAVIVLRSNKKQYINRVFSLYLVFLGSWSLSGLIDKVIFTQSAHFVIWTYRWAYISSLIAVGFFFLFCLAVYYGEKPPALLSITAMLPNAAGSVLSLTPFVIRSASIVNGDVTVKHGSLYPVVIALILVPFLIACSLFLKKWISSSGIDRARVSIILLSSLVFFFLAFTFVVILPSITGNQKFTGIAFLLGIIPIAGFSYAIIRFRLLDVRIVIRKIGVYVIASILFGMPLVSLLLLLHQLGIPPVSMYAILTLTFSAMFFFAPKILASLRKFAARVLFSGTYDDMELAENSFTRLSNSSSLQEGVSAVLEEITPALTINKIELIIPSGVIDDRIWQFTCAPDDNGSCSTNVSNLAEIEGWITWMTGIRITEELQRWPKNTDDRLTAKELGSRGYTLGMDMRVRDKLVGYLLVGEKVTHAPITQTDISLLEKISERLGIFIDNYSLSAKLAAQLEHQRNLYRELHDAYKFKSEIMQVASHEFRTPITVASGFALTLKDNWERLDESEKVSFLENIVEACGRITDLTNQFLSITTLEQGDLVTQLSPFKMSRLVKKVCESLKPEEQERLIIEADPEMFIVSDIEHLTLILKNLVDNALRFSPADKPVIIKAWKNSICDFIQVRDFGKGIPKDMTEKVFEPFVRLERVHHHSKGIGLGLYIVRLLSSKLGIEVEIDSAEGKGTTVTLSIRYE